MLAPMQSSFSGWSDDFTSYSVHLHAVNMDPFASEVVEPSCLDGGGKRGGEDAVEDYLFGRDCRMDEEEWACFCREVLLLDVPIPQTMDAVVDVIDEVLVFIVRAVAGCSEFSVGSESRLMGLVVMLVRFFMLCGGSAVLPREYAMFRFGKVDPFGRNGVSSGGRAFAHKVVRRLVSLGRCARGLIRVAWENSRWRDAGLMGLLGLDGGKDHRLCDVWRAAVGMNSRLAHFMRNVIGPSYFMVDPGMGGYEDHEYDVPVWRTNLPQCPMSAETMVGSVFALLVDRDGGYSSYGGVDRQCKVFLHNLHWGFLREAKYRSVRADTPFPRDMLAMFGIEVGVLSDGSGSPGDFRVIGVRTWTFGGTDGVGLYGGGNEAEVALFLSALDGGEGVKVDHRARRREHDRAEATRLVARFAHLSGMDDAVMDLIASVSLEDL